MNDFDYPAIGQRIKVLRKQKGLNQTELGELLGKSMRTVQKYETGEIEVSIAVVNHLAKILDVPPTFILGYEVNTAPIRSMADVMDFLFQLDRVATLKFDIDVQKPPRSNEWTCSIRFNGKAPNAEHNADMCLFLEQWEDMREDLHSGAIPYAKLQKWQDQTIAYYAGAAVERVEPEE